MRLASCYMERLIQTERKECTCFRKTNSYKERKLRDIRLFMERHVIKQILHFDFFFVLSLWSMFI